MMHNLSSRSAMILVSQGMRVVDQNGKALGKVTDVVYDEAAEQLTSFSVQHALFGRKRKPIPAHLVKQVTDGVVTLKFSIKEFKELGDRDDQP